MDRLTLLPCPFCGHQSDDLDILEGSTFRWRIGSCKGCGATTGEERIQTSGEGSSAEWEQNCKERINKSWNRRQSLSQEAVRDEALEEAASVDQREVELRGWREAIRVLKRDPNAAAESYESAHPKALDEPAPAAPDVASMVKRLRNCCTMIGYATSGAERTSHKRNADDAEAALLSRLDGPTDDTLWAICNTSEAHGDRCLKCPAQVETAHGPSTQACRLIAEDQYYAVLGARYGPKLPPGASDD